MDGRLADDAVFVTNRRHGNAAIRSAKHSATRKAVLVRSIATARSETDLQSASRFIDRKLEKPWTIITSEKTLVNRNAKKLKFLSRTFFVYWVT